MLPLRNKEFMENLKYVISAGNISKKLLMIYIIDQLEIIAIMQVNIESQHTAFVI